MLDHMSGRLDESYSPGFKGQQVLKQWKLLPPSTQVLSASLLLGILLGTQLVLEKDGSNIHELGSHLINTTQRKAVSVLNL